MYFNDLDGVTLFGRFDVDEVNDQGCGRRNQCSVSASYQVLSFTPGCTRLVNLCSTEFKSKYIKLKLSQLVRVSSLKQYKYHEMK